VSTSDGAADRGRDGRGDRRSTALIAPVRGPGRVPQLASLHLTLATTRQQDAQIAQLTAAYRAPAQSFLLFAAPTGQSVLQDPIALGVNGQVSGRVSAAYQDSQTEATLAVDAYEQLAKLQPNDPNVQLELAQAAQQTGDAATAIPLTRVSELVRRRERASSAQQLKLLMGTAAASSG
jgi:hypothetical protein